MAVFLELKAVEKRLKIAFFNKFEAGRKRRELILYKATEKRLKTKKFFQSGDKQARDAISLLNRVNAEKNKEFTLNFKDFLFHHHKKQHVRT